MGIEKIRLHLQSPWFIGGRKGCFSKLKFCCSGVFKIAMLFNWDKIAEKLAADRKLLNTIGELFVKRSFLDKNLCQYEYYVI